MSSSASTTSSKRSASVDLVRRPRAQQRLDRGEVLEDEVPLLSGLAKVVRLAAGHALEDHLGWRTQQYDRVEARIELPLVLDAPRDEEHSVAVVVEQRLDPVLTPHPLRPRLPLGPTAVVGVHHPVTSPGELGERRRLARARHPRHKHDGH